MDCFDSSRPGRAMRGGLSSLLAVGFGRGTAAFSQLSCLPVNGEHNWGLGKNRVKEKEVRNEIEGI